MPFEGLHNRLTHEIIGAAQKVHRTLGPGFAESTYHKALAREFVLRKTPFEIEKEFTVQYENADCGTYRTDIVVDGKVIVELKATSGLCNEHKAQTVSYLKASNLPIAVLMNFGTQSLEVRRYDRCHLK